MMALFITLAIGIVLASYLGLISSRHKVSVRSMDWNAAIPVLDDQALAAGNSLVVTSWAEL